MKRGVYCMEYIVPIEREDMEEMLKTIVTATCPNSEKGRVVQLLVTMEYDENE